MRRSLLVDSSPHPHRRNGFHRLAVTLKHARNAYARRRAVFTTSLLCALIISAAVIWPSLRAHTQAVAVLKILSGQPVPWLVKATVAAPIHTQDILFTVPSDNRPQRVRARLYLPDNKPDAPALIVLHGVHHLGIDEPRLEAFASAMARCGIRVLTPELPDIKDYHVDTSSIRTIGESAHWFAQQTGNPVGVIGLSFSGGLAMIAAANPAYRADFKFVFAVGAQDSMARVAEYYRTGRDLRPNGSTEVLTPHTYGPLVLEYEYVDDFVPLADVPALRSVLRANLYEDPQAEKTALAALTPAQRTEATSLMNVSLASTQALIASSNRKRADELAALSPHDILKTLNTPVYLLHGEADNIIPSAETLWMAGELPHSTLKAVLVSPVISHIDFESSKPTILDQWRLIHFFALVLHASEAKD
jgi:dienelactone hydrolase